MRSIFATLILSSTLLLGCGANKKIEEYADKACACKDKDCATAVANEFADWMKSNKDARGDSDKAAKDAERFAKCVMDKGGDMTKFMDVAKDM